MQSHDFNAFMNVGIKEIYHGEIGIFKFILKGLPKVFK